MENPVYENYELILCMTDKFTPTDLKQLLGIILHQLEFGDSLFGIQKALFFYPNENELFRSYRFGQLLETPIGVAAGPHTQLSQNIVAAWLTGARYIELKTVQWLDNLEISKPCIDAQDETYNCEWSQELNLRQSFEQYIDAWIIIHILKDTLKIGLPEQAGFIFNMSVGYNLKGILEKNVQDFLDNMNDASNALKIKIKEIEDIYPNIVNLSINPQISNNITLSTMHGCPPDEIEKIGEYLLNERKLHTTIKLNPTLPGKEALQDIIRNSGFETQVPDEAFEHDLKYSDAVQIIKNLKEKASAQNLFFGIKLTNTLESINFKNVFPAQEKMMYAGGKILHPIAINLARKLQNEFYGLLDISFSGGVDAFNIKKVLECGLYPATVCSDLLKPGGYGRLAQYISNIQDFNISNNNKSANLNVYADKVCLIKDFKKTGLRDLSIKTRKKLDIFDCTFAPCQDTCPSFQDIPSYMYFTAIGDFESAYNVILETNPFPNSTGMICDHTCRNKCTRINYDNPLLIREIKRFLVETHNRSLNPEKSPAYDLINIKTTNKKVSIIGAGPAGLSCAYFLKKAGIYVDIYEAKHQAGGMISAVVPKFRLPNEAVDIDIGLIQDLGVHFIYDKRVTKEFFYKIKNESDAVFIATGAQEAYKLNIPGSEVAGVLNPLEFLFDVKKGNKMNIGKNIVIIGGGNTAMDAARTAYRISGENGKVTILYRRTLKQMPAENKEIKDTMDEGINVMELVSPIEIISDNEKIKSLVCIKMKPGKKDADGRPLPIEIKGSEFEIPCDTLIPAIGQGLLQDFINEKDLKAKEGSYETQIENIFVGGDALRGASNLINAVGDGRKAAAEIINNFFKSLPEEILPVLPKIRETKSIRKSESLESFMLKKAFRIFGEESVETDLNDRKNFNLVSDTLSKEQAIKEASRCLLCDVVCNICTTLCPNLALQYFKVNPVIYKLQKVNNNILTDDVIFEVNQDYQIIHIADWCNQCGNCDTFCPSEGAPYKVKPHLYLNEEAFNKDNEGYYYDKELRILHAKEIETAYSLKDENINWKYETENFLALINKSDLNIIEFSAKDTGEFNLKKAAEMSIIMNACKNYY